MVGRLQAFLDLYSSESSRHTYQWALKNFFKIIYGDAVSTADAADQYFTEQRDYQADVQALIQAQQGRPPKTIRTLLSGVRTFLLENEVELSQSFYRRLRRRLKGSHPMTQDTVPDVEALQMILSHMPIQGKALSLLLASSGMRIGETLQLQLDDIKMEQRRIHILGKYTKSGNPRTVFYSREAQKYLEEWLANRERYLKQSIGRTPRNKEGKKLKTMDDPRVFPFGANTAYYFWRQALRKSGNGARDKATNRYKIHHHVLRKFFRTKLGKVMELDVVEALMGHEGYLTRAYRRYSIEELQALYRKNEDVLTIFGNGSSHPDVEALREEFRKTTDASALERLVLERQVSEQQREIARLEHEAKATQESMQGLQGEVTRLEREAETTQTTIQQLQDEVGRMRPWLERFQTIYQTTLQERV